MPDPTTPAKGLTQPTVGGDNNTWGGLLNTDLSLIDSALGGTLSLSISGNTTLNSTQAENTGYEFAGTLTGTAAITWPTFYGLATIQNATTGGFAITCGMSSGASVTVFNGETTPIWSDGTSFIRLVPASGISSSKTTSYTVAQSDANTTISLGGSTGYTVTVPAASGFDPDFQVRLYNSDAGRAKTLAINGYSNFFLWPNQSVVVQNIGGAWQLYPRKQRWQMSSAAFYVDPGGSDSNDGLTPGSAMATISNAWTVIRDQTDGQASINLTPGATYNVGTGVALAADESGAFGRLIGFAGDPTLANPPIIQCNAASSALQLRDGAWISINGIKFTTIGNNSTAVNLSQTALADMQNCIWGNFPLGYCIQIADDAWSNITATHRFVTGSATAFLYVESGSKAVISATIDFNSVAYTFSVGFIQEDLMGRVQIGGTTFTNTGSYSGPKYQLTNGSFLQLSGVTIPGSVGSADATSLAY
jgi:hypothetical protein